MDFLPNLSIRDYDFAEIAKDYYGWRMEIPYSILMYHWFLSFSGSCIKHYE
jgi:hypothetical protein